VEVLRADSIYMRFGDRTVLSSATLRAQASKVTALLGRNGQGKSTLLRIACGVLTPTNGCVHFLGQPLLHPRLDRLARQGLFLLADRDLLIATVALDRQLQWIAQRFHRPFVTDALALVGLTDRATRPIHQLSGGERRRAELAAAWLRGPVCLLADEPYRGVAPLDAEILSQAFRAMASEGCAVVLTGHEVPTILDVADHVVWCTYGTTYELGSPAVARTHESFYREYLATSTSSTDNR
jgi:ABC-type multidrug transport system ATPase subunit